MKLNEWIGLLLTIVTFTRNVQPKPNQQFPIFPGQEQLDQNNMNRSSFNNSFHQRASKMQWEKIQTCFPIRRSIGIQSNAFSTVCQRPSTTGHRHSWANWDDNPILVWYELNDMGKCQFWCTKIIARKNSNWKQFETLEIKIIASTKLVSPVRIQSYESRYYDTQQINRDSITIVHTINSRIRNVFLHSAEYQEGHSGEILRKKSKPSLLLVFVEELLHRTLLKYKNVL